MSLTWDCGAVREAVSTHGASDATSYGEGTALKSSSAPSKDSFASPVFRRAQDLANSSLVKRWSSPPSRRASTKALYALEVERADLLSVGVEYQESVGGVEFLDNDGAAVAKHFDAAKQIALPRCAASSHAAAGASGRWCYGCRR